MCWRFCDSRRVFHLDEMLARRTWLVVGFPIRWRTHRRPQYLYIIYLYLWSALGRVAYRASNMINFTLCTWLALQRNYCATIRAVYIQTPWHRVLQQKCRRVRTTLPSKTTPLYYFQTMSGEGTRDFVRARPIPAFPFGSTVSSLFLYLSRCDSRMYRIPCADEYLRRKQSGGYF